MNENSNPAFYKEEYSPKHSILSEEVYGLVLDNIVIACVDMLVIFNGQLLIGKRAYHPQKDWWVIGGRLKTGESAEEAATRHVKRDLGIDTETNRYKYILNFYGSWALRAHYPAENGTHTQSNVYAIELNESEYKSLKMGNEYVEWQWVTYQDVADNNFHRLIKDAAEELKAKGLLN